MESLQLQEIFTTIGIGIYALIFVSWVIYIGYLLMLLLSGKYNIIRFQDQVRNLINQRKKIDIGDSIILVVLVLIYCVGIIVEQHTDYYADSRKSESWIARLTDQVIQKVPSESTSLFAREFQIQDEELMRYHTLIQDDKDTIRIRSLGRSIFSHAEIMSNTDFTVVNPSIDTFLTRDSMIARMQLGLQDSAKHRKALAYIASGIYYRAKNWCYSQDNYFYELEAIQKRVSFCRSLLFLNFFLIILCVIIVLLSSLSYILLYILQNLLNVSKAKYVLIKDHKLLITYFKRQMRNLVLFLIPFFFLIYWVNCRAYIYTEKNFNERAYGYYTSSFDNQNVKH